MTRIQPINVHPDDDYALEVASFTVPVWCCREWDVNPLFPWGRCRLCGEKPTTNPQAKP